MNSLRIAIIGSEVAGFARTGGLGDVLGALPRELARLGHEVKVFMPRYSTIDDTRTRITPLDMHIPIGLDSTTLSAGFSRHYDQRSRLETIFVENDDMFDRPELYRDPDTGSDWEDNDARFAFFARAVLEYMRVSEWKPNVIHAHDWQAAMVPVFLKAQPERYAFLADARSVLTIHNLGYQGVFDGTRFKALDLPASLFVPMTGALEYYEQVNFLKGGISFADKITTVSQQYAAEIQTKEFGCGLEGVLQERADDLVGIINGVDYTVWSPSRDKEIPYRYHTANLSGKRMTRTELLNKAGLPHREKVPLIGMVTRLADQKGLDLLAECADRLLALDVQLIVLGTGEAKYHEVLEALEKKYPDRVKAYLSFDDRLSHWIEAGSDMFLMPSYYEPCGLNQMYSLKYGTVPIVRKTGGLADTIEDYNSETGNGTGFVFTEYTAEAMLEAIERALEVYPKKRQWTRIMKAGMSRDFSWGRSARAYAELFANLYAHPEPAR